MFVGSNSFGHGLLRKYVIYFGTMFNNIWIKRFDGEGTLTQTMKVPLNYGPREKFLARLEGNPELDRPIAIQLPRMTFEMTGLYYDPSRKLSGINKISAPRTGDIGQVDWQHQPVPYNIDFTLSIMVKNIEDGTYIVEQILPYFNPIWTATLNINPDLKQKHDVPVTLDNISCNDTYEGNFIDRRAVIWTLNFTMKAYFFGRTHTGSDTLIRDIDVNIRAPGQGTSIADANSSNVDYHLNVNVKPGQNAQGNAVSYHEQTRLYTYHMSAAPRALDVSEKVTLDGNNYLYASFSNTSVFTARNIVGSIANGSVVYNSSGQPMTITSVSVAPLDSVNNFTISSTSDFGFIYDIEERL